MENRSKYIVIKGNGISAGKGYPTINIDTSFDNGIYHCKCLILDNTYYGIMSVVDGIGEIHLLEFNKECYGELIEVVDKTMINKDLIINAAMHLYDREIISLLEETYE